MMHRLPLNVFGSRNVTMEYRAFFPATFDFNKGGRLPGLSGGGDHCGAGSMNPQYVPSRPRAGYVDMC
jgi:hypothetical protein